MTKERIKKLADFFFSSNDVSDVPLKIAITTGQYSGNDLTRGSFISLMNILNKSENLKEGLKEFREMIEDEE
ncbi:MAG: hypothetical protein Q8M94_03160 [Ignavibacteria bacterium]|nr:hypothetical protein [Ignavibacteria bacterium]